MSLTEKEHPSDERLQAFGLGFETGPDATELEAHVAECSQCARVLEALPGDTLIGLLQEASTVLPGLRVAETGAIKTDLSVPPELANHSRYRVLQLLGAGGMGAVYKAEHRLMERVVALKVIQPSLLARGDAVERFNREVRAAARLSHPNIVTAYDADRAGQVHFLVTEFVEGSTLAQIVSDRGPLAVTTAANYVHQAACGLQHAYECGMVHRDIKPQNMIVTRSGQLRILDFGLARFISETGPASAITEFGAVMGTPDYLAPELARNAHQADIRADIYSLGCTLYYLLAGHPPYPEGTVIEKVMAHIERTPKALTEIRNDIPPKLAEIVSRMMATDQNSRYQQPAQVAAAIEEFTTGLQQTPGPQHSARDAGRMNKTRHGSRRRSLLLAGGLAAVLLAAGLAIVNYGNRSTSSGGSSRSSSAIATSTAAADSQAAHRVVAIWRKDDRNRRFVARAHLDSSAFQAQLEECEQDGLRPICINGYVGDQGETLFAGLWIDDEPPTPYIAKYDLDSRGFQRQHGQLPAGYHPIWLDVYGRGSSRRFAAIWVNDGREVIWQIATLLGVDASHRHIDEMAATGFHPSIVGGHTGPTGIPQLTLLFAKESGAVQVYPQLTFDELTETIKGLSADWRPIWIDVYPAESSRRYAMICAERPADPEWRFSSAPTVEEYQTQFEEQLRDGFRPLLISVD